MLHELLDKEESVIKWDTVERVLAMVTKQLERNEVVDFPEDTFYIEDVQLVYVPMKMSSFSTEKLYYPVWEVSTKRENKQVTSIQRIFIDPEGKIWY